MSAILLLIVAVILITMILSWGKSFTNEGLGKAKEFGTLSASDATMFVYSKSYKDGVVRFTYSEPDYLKDEDIIITHYRVLQIPEMVSVEFPDPLPLNQGDNIIPLPCLYEYSLSSSSELTIQLITTENKYIDVKQRDQGMVCTSGGTGTVADPKIICNAEDLNGIRTDLDANYALGKDIDLQCFSKQDVNGWDPIGTDSNRFSGSFDGQNKTISNLYINRPATNGVGLFGGIQYSEIKNVGLEDVNIIGNNYVGALVSNGGGTIVENYSTGTVSGNNIVGGLIGYFGEEYESTIDNSYSTCHVSGTGEIGGLIGANFSNITNSYSTGLVTGNSAIGGLVGTNESGVYSNSFYDTNTSGQSDTGKGVPKTTAEMKTQSTFTGWDFSSIWGMDSSTNSGYPYLRSNPPN